MLPPFKRSGDSIQQGGNFFLELKLLKLEVGDAQPTKVKISIYKGLQKLDETAPFQMHPNDEVVIDQSVLNFHVRSFERNKNITFKLALETLESTGEELGSFKIQTNSLILAFLKDGVNSFSRTDALTENMNLEYMLFIDKTKTQVEKSVRSYEKSQKDNNLETRNGNEWTITSPGASEKEYRVKRVNTHNTLKEEDLQKNRYQLVTQNRSLKPKVFLTGSQRDDLSKVSNAQIQPSQNKIWYLMEDGRQKVNNLEIQPANALSVPTVKSSIGTNLKLLAGLVVLGIVIYLVILLDDLDYGMDLVRTAIQDQIRSKYQ